MGLKSNPYKYTVRSSIHAHTSLYEGAPNALIESVLLGVRSVASDCRTGPREIIASHTPMEKQAHEVEYYEDGVLMPRFNSGDSFRLLECDRVEELWVDALLNLLSSQLNSKSAIRDVSESVIRRYCMSNMDNYVEKIVNNP